MNNHIILTREYLLRRAQTHRLTLMQSFVLDHCRFAKNAKLTTTPPANHSEP